MLYLHYSFVVLMIPLMHAVTFNNHTDGYSVNLLLLWQTSDDCRPIDLCVII